MEDRYLFKAKRLDNGEWVMGYYGVIGERNVIIEKYAENYYCSDTCESRHGNQIHEVNSKTICQCTGLKDKKGKLIYEGDIVKCLYNSYGENGVYIGKVIYREDTCCFVAANSESTDYEWWEEEKEVIGNIFDNPELLEE